MRPLGKLTIAWHWEFVIAVWPYWLTDEPATWCLSVHLGFVALMCKNRTLIDYEERVRRMRQQETEAAEPAAFGRSR